MLEMARCLTYTLFLSPGGMGARAGAGYGAQAGGMGAGAYGAAPTSYGGAAIMAPSGGMQRQQASAYPVAPAMGHMGAGTMLFSLIHMITLLLPARSDDHLSRRTGSEGGRRLP